MAEEKAWRDKDIKLKQAEAADIQMEAFLSTAGVGDATNKEADDEVALLMIEMQPSDGTGPTTPQAADASGVRVKRLVTLLNEKNAEIARLMQQQETLISKQHDLQRDQAELKRQRELLSAANSRLSAKAKAIERDDNVSPAIEIEEHEPQDIEQRSQPMHGDGDGDGIEHDADKCVITDQATAQQSNDVVTPEPNVQQLTVESVDDVEPVEQPLTKRSGSSKNIKKSGLKRETSKPSIKSSPTDAPVKRTSSSKNIRKLLSKRESSTSNVETVAMTTEQSEPVQPEPVQLDDSAAQTSADSVISVQPKPKPVKRVTSNKNIHKTSRETSKTNINENVVKRTPKQTAISVNPEFFDVDIDIPKGMGASLTVHKPVTTDTSVQCDVPVCDCRTIGIQSDVVKSTPLIKISKNNVVASSSKKTPKMANVVMELMNKDIGIQVDLVLVDTYGRRVSESPTRSILKTEQSNRAVSPKSLTVPMTSKPSTAPDRHVQIIEKDKAKSRPTTQPNGITGWNDESDREEVLEVAKLVINTSSPERNMSPERRINDMQIKPVSLSSPSPSTDDVIDMGPDLTPTPSDERQGSSRARRSDHFLQLLDATLDEVRSAKIEFGRLLADFPEASDQLANLKSLWSQLEETKAKLQDIKDGAALRQRLMSTSLSSRSSLDLSTEDMQSLEQRLPVALWELEQFHAFFLKLLNDVNNKMALKVPLPLGLDHPNEPDIGPFVIRPMPLHHRQAHAIVQPSPAKKTRQVALKYV